LQHLQFRTVLNGCLGFFERQAGGLAAQEITCAVVSYHRGHFFQQYNGRATLKRDGTCSEDGFLQKDKRGVNGTTKNAHCPSLRGCAAAEKLDGVLRFAILAEDFTQIFAIGLVAHVFSQYKWRKAGCWK
jgi:hypothetical protein